MIADVLSLILASSAARPAVPNSRRVPIDVVCENLRKQTGTPHRFDPAFTDSQLFLRTDEAALARSPEELRAVLARLLQGQWKQSSREFRLMPLAVARIPEGQTFKLQYASFSEPSGDTLHQLWRIPCGTSAEVAGSRVNRILGPAFSAGDQFMVTGTLAPKVADLLRGRSTEKVSAPGDVKWLPRMGGLTMATGTRRWDNLRTDPLADSVADLLVELERAAGVPVEAALPDLGVFAGFAFLQPIPVTEAFGATLGFIDWETDAKTIYGIVSAGYALSRTQADRRQVRAAMRKTILFDAPVMADYYRQQPEGAVRTQTALIALMRGGAVIIDEQQDPSVYRLYRAMTPSDWERVQTPHRLSQFSPGFQAAFRQTWPAFPRVVAVQPDPVVVGKVTVQKSLLHTMTGAAPEVVSAIQVVGHLNWDGYRPKDHRYQEIAIRTLEMRLEGTSLDTIKFRTLLQQPGPSVPLERLSPEWQRAIRDARETAGSSERGGPPPK